MKRSIDTNASLEELVEQFRIAAAEVQSAYHQLEQELLSGDEDNWEPPPDSEGLELPNLAPLYLMGTLVGGLSQASLVINQHLQVVSGNSEARKHFGLGEGTDLIPILAPLSLEVLQQLIDEVASKSDLDIRLKNGSSAGIYDVIYLDNPIEKGRLLLLVAQDLELDHLHAVEDQILKNLTRTLIHEIRTPLTSMQGYAELLLQVQGTDAKASNKLQMIQMGIERLNVLAGALGTVIHEPMEPHWIKVGLKGYLEHFVERYYERKNLSGGVIGLDGLEEDLEIVTDPELLRISLEELVNNAVESLDKLQDRGVMLRVERAGAEVSIQVSDRGPGTGEDDGSEWWVPFYTTKSGHLGLGLVQVRRIMDVLGGRVSLRVARNHGVEVTLTLPI